MPAPADRARWFPLPPAPVRPRVRLFCLPHAGGGASMYRAWVGRVGAGVAVIPIQLPGRENRAGEPAFAAIEPLAAALADLVDDPRAPWSDVPFAIFGYSMGALVAFELARELRRRGAAMPAHLVLAAHGAPAIGRRKPPIHQLSDADFLREIVGWNGIPAAIAGDPEVLEFFLPLLRADITLCERYVRRAEPPLDCPLTICGATDDPDVPVADLEPWRDETTGRVTTHTFPGGHFFVRDRRDELLALVASVVDPLAGGRTAGHAAGARTIVAG